MTYTKRKTLAVGLLVAAAAAGGTDPAAADGIGPTIWDELAVADFLVRVAAGGK